MIENEKVEEMQLELEEKSENTIKALEGDYGSLRTGRANPNILNKVEAEAYGGMSKLIELGNISTLDARTLQINLWDKSLLKSVEKAILQSNIGITPVNNGNVILLTFPVMTEERRKELVKQAKSTAENYRTTIRNIRRDGNDELKKQQKAGELTEDQLKTETDKLQKLTDKYIEEINKIYDAKEKAIMD